MCFWGSCCCGVFMLLVLYLSARLGEQAVARGSHMSRCFLSAASLESTDIAMAKGNSMRGGWRSCFNKNQTNFRCIAALLNARGGGGGGNSPQPNFNYIAGPEKKFKNFLKFPEF